LRYFLSVGEQFNLYLPTLSTKGGSPKGRRGKENTLLVKQQAGFEPGAFGQEKKNQMLSPFGHSVTTCQFTFKNLTEKKGVIFTSRPFQPKVALPRRGGVKKTLYL